MKTLGNTDISKARANVPDIKTFGNGDIFQLLSKVSSESEGWMKSTKAMSIQGVGCVVQVTTQQGDNISEALTFVPGVKIHKIEGYSDGEREPILWGRKLVPMVFVPNTNTIDTCENGCCVPTKDNPYGDCENHRHQQA